MITLSNDTGFVSHKGFVELSFILDFGGTRTHVLFCSKSINSSFMALHHFGNFVAIVYGVDFEVSSEVSARLAFGRWANVSSENLFGLKILAFDRVCLGCSMVCGVRAVSVQVGYRFYGGVADGSRQDAGSCAIIGYWSVTSSYAKGCEGEACSQGEDEIQMVDGK